MVRPSIQKAALFILSIFAGVTLSLVALNIDPGSLRGVLLGQVGVAVGVLPNPYNTLNDALNKRAAYLDEQQAYINEQEAMLASTTAAANSPSGNPFLEYLTIAVGVLAFLVLLNFLLDWRRSRKKEKDVPGSNVLK